jgi:hypothetical protein
MFSWSRFFKQNLNSKHFAHKQIKFDRNLIARSWWRSAKSFHGTNHWSQARITLPAPLPIFAAKITKSEHKNWLDKGTRTNEHAPNHTCSHRNYHAIDFYYTIIDAYVLYLTLDLCSNLNWSIFFDRYYNFSEGNGISGFRRDLGDLVQ